jgi:hypothetical protein
MTASVMVAAAPTVQAWTAALVITISSDAALESRKPSGTNA